MKKIGILVSVVLMICSNTFAQSEETLLTINDKDISKEEFERIYEKNKTNLTTGEVTSIEDYLELFINFKLKVFEAQELGYDTLSSFIKEFDGYKKQLARPYLLDNQANEMVIQEAYERMQYEVRASHILIELDAGAEPKDTLVAYNKAIKIRKRILFGEQFEVVAKGSSDDPSVKNNGGDLGYFTAFQMIYPFESAVFNLNIGEISLPVRTRFGYHIIKVTDKRKARGEVKVAHIMLTVPRGSTEEIELQKKELVNNIYHRIKEGEDFTDLAKTYSEDRGSARNGGELPWFGTGRMVKEFEDASFSLEYKGDISKPVKTGFGWHIIKLIDKKDIPSFDEAKAEIKRKVGNDKRSDIARKALINKLKKEYKFYEKQCNVPVTYDSTENVYNIRQEYLKSNHRIDDTLIAFLDKVFTPEDFLNYSKKVRNYQNFNAYQYNLLYKEFVEEKILAAEESVLEKKYPEYKYLLKEYHDGMLLFEITDDVVWSKAVNDSLGLKKYYKENLNNYLWDERWEGSIYKCANTSVYKSVNKIVNKKSFGKKIKNQDLLNQFNDDLEIETGIFKKGDNLIIDKKVWGVDSEESYPLIIIKGKVKEPKPKLFIEAKGAVISDYQDFLEKEWIKKLREKYNINVNQQVLSTIK